MNNFLEELKGNKNNIKKIINRNSKILNISHRDLDGIGCRIVLSNYFDSVVSIESNYEEINEIVSQINFNNYDAVIITDISPDEKLIQDCDNLILIDHHDTAIHLHDPENFRFVYEGDSGTMMTKQFLEHVFSMSLSYLDEIVYLINDYDMWIHNDKRSKLLNLLYYRYWGDGFFKRFFDGHIQFTNDEKEFFIVKEKLFNDTWNKLDIHDLETIDASFCITEEFCNDIADKILTEGKSLVFIRNPIKNTLSIRSMVDGFHLGLFLQKHGLGGGHAKAAGVNIKDGDDLITILQDVERKLYDEVESIRLP